VTQPLDRPTLVTRVFGDSVIGALFTVGCLIAVLFLAARLLFGVGFGIFH
jgi:hypothetical protein